MGCAWGQGITLGSRGWGRPSLQKGSSVLGRYLLGVGSPAPVFQCSVSTRADRVTDAAGCHHPWTAGCGVIPLPAAPTMPAGEQPACSGLWGELCLSLLHERCPRFCWRQRGGEGKKEKRAMKCPRKVPPAPDFCALTGTASTVPVSEVSILSQRGSLWICHPIPKPVLRGQRSLSSVFGTAWAQDLCA